MICPFCNRISSAPRALAGAGGFYAIYAGFLDARIRYERVKRLLESVAGVPEAVAREVIPGDAVIREFIGGSTSRFPTMNSRRRVATGRGKMPFLRFFSRGG